jgi:high affinity sulfate transporter 1
MSSLSKIETWLPGLKLVRTYRRELFPHDLVAGLSLAAVALPVGIAYSQLAGFPPVVGIYSCILPAVAYALFGSSRQLVVNPDAAACAIVAATVAPLAAGDATRYQDLSILLTLATGLFCIAGGLAGLGAIANFLSRPILTGYLNGIALTIIVGQLGTLLGFQVGRYGFFRTLAEAISRLAETNVTTLTLGLSLLILLRVLKRWTPRIPAALVAAVLGCAAVSLFSLQQKGVTVVGTIPAGFPAPHIPSVATADIWPLVFGAAGIMLVSFCSMMTTARGFAAKNGYSIEVNREMFALGISDIASAFNRGFVVSGADSRTAVADASGGKTQITTVVAAVTMAIVLLFLTTPLALVPSAALAAILMSSAIGLFDIRSLRDYFHASKPEFRHSIVAMLGVMTVGVLPGVLIAVALAFLNLIRIASRPRDAVLGLADDDQDLYCISEEEGGKPVPGLIIYRFEAALIFFNADYFKERVLTLVSQARNKPEWFLLDAESIPLLDVTGSLTLQSLRAELASKGISFGITRPRALFRLMLERSGLIKEIGNEWVFPTVHAGARAFMKTRDEVRAKEEAADKRGSQQMSVSA